MSGRKSRSKLPISLKYSQTPSRSSSCSLKSSSAKQPISRSSSLAPARARMQSKSPSGVLGRFTSSATKQRPSRFPSSDSTQQPGSSSKKHKLEWRPIEDKKWQNEEIKKIQNFIKKIDPNMILKRPFSLSTFTEVINLFLKVLSIPICITSQTLREQLPEVMAILNYPVNIPASTLKSVGNFSKNLGIWSFLLQLCTEREETIGFNSCSIIGDLKLNYHIEICNNYDDENSSNEAINKKFLGELYDLHNFDQKVYEEKNEELNCILTSIDKLQNKCESLEKKCKNKEEYKNSILSNLNEIKERISGKRGLINQGFAILEELDEKLDVDTESYQNELRNLNTKIQEIGCSTSKLNGIKIEIETNDHALKLCEERLKQQMSKILDTDQKITSNITEQLSIIYSINNQINDFQHVHKSAEDLLLPESRIASLDVLEILEQKEKLKKFRLLLTNMVDELLSKNGNNAILQKTLNNELEDLHKTEKKCSDEKETLLKEADICVAEQKALNGNKDTSKLIIKRKNNILNIENVVEKAIKDLTKSQVKLENFRFNSTTFFNEVFKMLTEWTIKLNESVKKTKLKKQKMFIEAKKQLKIVENELSKGLLEFLDKLENENVMDIEQAIEITPEDLKSLNELISSLKSS